VAEANQKLASFTTFSHPIALLIWVGLQLGVLLLGVMQVPLSEQFPRPAERMAATEMVVAQIAFAALLFPILMPTAGAVMVMVGATWPFLLLAGVLSSSSPYRMLEVGAFISGWIISLGIVGVGVSDLRWRMWWVGVGGAVAIGGAIAAYLRMEFGSGEVDGLLFGPIVGGIDVLNQSGDRMRAWGFVFGFLIFATAARLTRLKLARRGS
jgi:hypothetical protein